MSAPTRQFGKLSIDTQMPETRRQAQGRLLGRAPAPESTSSSDEDSSSDQNEAPSAHSPSKSQSSRSKGKQLARSNSPASSTDESTSPIMSRAYKTRDILSTFDADVLPDDFRPDIFARIDLPRTPAECLRQLDLEGTIFQLAVNDHAVYKSLSKAQPVQARAVDFFDKMAKQIRLTLTAFDEYAENGNLSRDTPQSVKELGDRLQKFVKIIRNEVVKRHPHGGERAAGCLIYLLREVCQRNKDAFENNTWGRSAPRGEVEDDRNLLQYLIGRASGNTPLFGLDALKSLPEAILATADKREQLNEIRELLLRCQAPKPYRAAFQGMLDALAVQTSPGRGPQAGQKRPAPGATRGGQKRSR